MTAMTALCWKTTAVRTQRSSQYLRPYLKQVSQSGAVCHDRFYNTMDADTLTSVVTQTCCKTRPLTWGASKKLYSWAMVGAATEDSPVHGGLLRSCLFMALQQTQKVSTKQCVTPFPAQMTKFNINISYSQCSSGIAIYKYSDKWTIGQLDKCPNYKKNRSMQFLAQGCRFLPTYEMR